MIFFFLIIDRCIYKIYNVVSKKKRVDLVVLLATLIVQGGMIMSKRIAKGILSILFMAACLITVQPQKVQAAQEIPISSAQE